MMATRFQGNRSAGSGPHRLATVLLLLACLFSSVGVAEERCSYRTWVWDTRSGQAVNHAFVDKPYREISVFEVDQDTGCSVCAEDQRRISIPPLKPFQLCHVLASPVEAALRQLLAAGEPISHIVGYRVGLTRGPVDDSGLRTRFSNHSFGVALDINPRFNGLYDRCIEFGKSCRLRRGGPWWPGQPGSITADSAIVAALAGLGLRWGGEIAGQQKDFMHFSPSGY